MSDPLGNCGVCGHRLATSSGYCDNCGYGINHEKEKLRLRLQRAEELLREEKEERLAERDHDRSEGFEWSAQVHQRKADEIGAFLGESHD